MRQQRPMVAERGDNASESDGVRGGNGRSSGRRGRRAGGPRDIDGPDGEHEQSRNPQRKIDVGYPGKSERPDQGHGRRVKAGQMPKPQGAGRVDYVSVVCWL